MRAIWHTPLRLSVILPSAGAEHFSSRPDKLESSVSGPPRRLSSVDPSSVYGLDGMGEWCVEYDCTFSGVFVWLNLGSVTPSETPTA